MPKQVDIPQIKNKILNSSFNVFALHGHQGTSMRDLADNLGVSTGTLYHYFKNKNDLFSQMIEARVEEDISEALTNISTELSSVEKMNKLVNYVLNKEDYFQKLLFLIMDFYQTTLKQNSREKYANVDKLFKKIFHHYRLKIEEHLGFNFPKAGEIILGMLIGIYFQQIVDPKKISLKVIKDYLVSINANIGELKIQ